jgi:TolB-like protein
MKLDTTGPPVVAVLPFAISGPGSDSLSALGKGMAAAISYDLFQVKSIRVVERLRLHSILEELALADSGITDKKTGPRVGRLVGARQLVNSGLKFLPDHSVSIQSGVIDARDASYKPALLTENQFARLWQVQKDITFAVIDQLGVVLTPEERNAIEKIPTRNIEAFMAYSRGIESMNNGDYESANVQFQEAAKLDPGFEQAKAMESESGTILEGSVPPGQFESSLAAGLPAGGGSGPALTGPPPMDIINSVSRPATDPRTDDAPGGGAGTGTANVGGSIP